MPSSRFARPYATAVLLLVQDGAIELAQSIGLILEGFPGVTE
jgi:hypothetical protein